MISTERLKHLVTYDPETGVFRWKNPNKGRAGVGSIIGGWSAGKGYRMVGIDFQRQYLHRLAWQYVYGFPPTLHIDHINGDPSDNRIANLRECDASQNAGNMRRHVRKKGLKGAYLEPRTGRYFSSIQARGKRLHLGTFDTEAEAHQAYVDAAKCHFGRFARAQ